VSVNGSQSRLLGSVLEQIYIPWHLEGYIESYMRRFDGQRGDGGALELYVWYDVEWVNGLDWLRAGK
jgi:hypothetical protein